MSGLIDLHVHTTASDGTLSPSEAVMLAHSLGLAAIAAQCSLRIGGTWDGSVKNLRFGWSPLYVFDDGSESADLLEQMGAAKITFDDLKDLRDLPRPSQLTM